MSTTPSPVCPVLELRQVSKSFGTNTVLHGVQLCLLESEFMVLLGESGCGKSTLLRLIAGLESCNSGQIFFRGVDITRVPPHRRGIAMIDQSATCFDHVSVEENLRLAIQATASRPTEFPSTHRSQRELCDYLTHRLELENCLHQKASSLSGGQLQRLAIARAILLRRPVVLFDEPLAHLNESLRQSIRFLLQELHREFQQSCLYITHDATEAMQLADRIAILADGKIQQVGAPEELYRSPSSAAVANLMGRPPIDWLAIPLDTRKTQSLGVRPQDWKIESIADSNSSTSIAFTLRCDEQAVYATGNLLWKRTLGHETWLRVGDSTQSVLAVVPEAYEPRLLACQVGDRITLRSDRRISV